MICVRLALFAEMMKGKSWTPATLVEVGGTSGVGLTFLEETFSAATAPPEYRFHQKAARRVLKALLPDSGTDIKGEMKSRDELLGVSGYNSRPEDFDDLVRVLDREIRLITPTDPEGIANDEEDVVIQADAGERYYQLTHDYLVHSLRDWLSRKQQETRRGRAELKLSERANLWCAKPDNRHLPSLPEWVSIRALTDKNRWTATQRKMMATATRRHGIRSIIGMLFVLFLALGAQQIFALGERRNLVGRVQTAVAAMAKSKGVLVPRAIEDLNEFPPDMVLEELRKQFQSYVHSRNNEVEKLSLAYALADLGDVRVSYLVSQIRDASSDEFDNFVFALGKSNTKSIAEINHEAQDADYAARHVDRDRQYGLNNSPESITSEQIWRFKARLAMVAFRLNAPKLAHDMCKPQPDPTQRGWFIEECSAWHGNRETLAIQLARVKEPSLRTGIALAVGSVPVKHISTSEKTAWSPLLANWHTNESDSLTHSTADWVMRRWKLQSLWGARHSHELLSGSQTSVQESKAPPTEESGEKRWSTNSIGMTLITIPEGKFARDVERRFSSDGRNFKHRNGEIVKRFLLADREVSRQQFLEFIRDPDADKPSWASDLRDRSKLQHAINAVNWYDAIMFCNWLSKRENLVAYYEEDWGKGSSRQR